MNYPYCKISFTIHRNASDKQLGAAISKNNKPIEFFIPRLSKAQLHYTMKNKELLLIVKCLKQFQGILFGYEIDVFSNLENLVYEEKISASQIFMQWRLILK